MSAMKLTNLGVIAATYGSVTPPKWWQELGVAVNHMADDDGEWQLIFEERINGMSLLRARIEQYGLDWLSAVAGPGGETCAIKNQVALRAALQGLVGAVQVVEQSYLDEDCEYVAGYAMELLAAARAVAVGLLSQDGKP